MKKNEMRKESGGVEKGKPSRCFALSCLSDTLAPSLFFQQSIFQRIALVWIRFPTSPWENFWPSARLDSVQAQRDRMSITGAVGGVETEASLSIRGHKGK